jgi:molybdenum cofactor cytidylyltransferase
MTTLHEALDVRAGECIAFVGAGGKTTLAYRLLRELANAGQRAVFTTTTQIWEPQPGSVDRIIDLTRDDPRALDDADWRSAAVFADVVGAPNPTAVPGAFWPTLQTKRRGPAPDWICAARRPGVTWIVEADGARGLRIKAPGPAEPVIPPCADVVAVVASLDALGRPLDDRIAHRVDRVAALTGCMPGAVITPPTLVTLLAHPAGGRKGIPPTARAVAVLTQHSDAAPHPDAAAVAAELRGHGFARVVVVAPRAAAPVLA